MNLSPDGERPSEIVNSAKDIEKPGPDIYNPFTPENLKLSQEYLDQIMATPVLNTISVAKPGDQEFVRVCPDIDYHHLAALITHHEEKGARYLVLPAFIPHLDKIKYHFEHLYLYVTRQNELGFWPVKVRFDNRENKWLESAEAAVEEATEHWICITSNQRKGRYETAKAIGIIPDPDWPKLIQGKSIWELLAIAFGSNRLVDRETHPLVQKLRGAN
jgi:hypothetical protein